MYRYYSAVADACPWPVIIYSAQGFTNGICVSPELLKKLMLHPNIAGIKDTSRNQMDASFDVAGNQEGFTVMSGSLENLISCLKHGGKAGVLSMSNCFPRLCCSLIQQLLNGTPDGQEAYDWVKAITAATGGRAGVASVKTVMNEMGYMAGVLRLPVLPASEKLMQEIRQEMTYIPEITQD